MKRVFVCFMILSCTGCAGTRTITLSSNGSAGLAQLAVKLYELHKQISCPDGVVREERSVGVHKAVSTDGPKNLSVNVHARAEC